MDYAHAGCHGTGNLPAPQAVRNMMVGAAVELSPQVQNKIHIVGVAIQLPLQFFLLAFVTCYDTSNFSLSVVLRQD